MSLDVVDEFPGILLKPATMTTPSGNPVISVVITWMLVQVNHLTVCSGVLASK